MRWSLAAILGILVAIWIFIGLRSFSIVSACSIVLLLVLVAILSVRIATSNPVMPIEDGGETSDFWAIFEMSLAMPLSWLPSAPWEIMTAVQPISCRTFTTAKKRIPSVPKNAFVHSMPFWRVRAPINPARKSIAPPSRCPNITAESEPRQ